MHGEWAMFDPDHGANFVLRARCFKAVPRWTAVGGRTRRGALRFLTGVAFGATLSAEILASGQVFFASGSELASLGGYGHDCLAED